MKKYILLTANIIPIGGMQLYSYGKSEFLRKNNWDVKIIYDGDQYSRCDIDGLNKYRDGAFPIVSFRPMDLPTNIMRHALDRMISYVGNVNENETVLVESQSDTLAYWGELLAEKLRGYHICFNCNELFRGNNKSYDIYHEFFYFKYKRKELLGLHNDTLKKVFDGYYDVECDNTFVFDALEPDPIQNVNEGIADNIKKCDFNIAFLGRTSKGYFDEVIKGIKEFATKYNDSSINLIVIGDATAKKQFLESTFEESDNVHLSLLGNLVPIPRAIYKKIDLMIAGAVCAEISAREGVPTVVADCENYKANGVLGYTVQNSMYFDPNVGQTSFCEAIEDALINKEYQNYPYLFPNAPKSDEVYKSQFHFFDEANRYKEYYKFECLKKYGLKQCFFAAIKEYFYKEYSILLHKKTIRGKKA